MKAEGASPRLGHVCKVYQEGRRVALQTPNVACNRTHLGRLTVLKAKSPAITEGLGRWASGKDHLPRMHEDLSSQKAYKCLDVVECLELQSWGQGTQRQEQHWGGSLVCQTA